MTRRLAPKGDFQPDLFAASFADIPIRDQRDTMKRPFVSLSKRPRLTPIEYDVGDIWVEVSPNPQFGMATIWDADILLWASTQITEALDRGLPASRTLKFTAETREAYRPLFSLLPRAIHIRTHQFRDPRTLGYELYGHPCRHPVSDRLRCLGGQLRQSAALPRLLAGHG